jgi:RNA polymerase-binding transcription factor DksA
MKETMQDTWQKFQQELQEINDFGDCQLCGEIIVDGLLIEPFGNCCDKCVNEIKGDK